MEPQLWTPSRARRRIHRPNLRDCIRVAPWASPMDADGGSFFAVQDMPFNPKAIPGLKFWVRADLGITQSGGAVSKWVDQSGTGDSNKDGVQAVAGQKPTFNAADASFNSQPSLSFSAVSNSILQGAGAWASALTIPSTQFIVCLENAGASNAMAWGDQTTCGIGQGSVSNVWTLWDTGSIMASDSTSAPVTSPTVIGGRFVGSSSSQILVSQKTPQAVNGSSTVSLSTTYIGGAISGSSIFGNWSGKICEIIAYSGLLSVADIDRVMTYLGTRYGITIGA